MNSVVVRLATPNEAEQIAEVLHAAFVEYESLYTVEAFESTTPKAEEVRKRMEQGPVWVALREDCITGTLAAVTTDEGLYLRGMGVLPEARGTAQGKLLLEVAEAYARQNGLTRIYLSTTPFLDKAIHLYESVGFKRTTDGPYDLCSTPLFTMEKLPRIDS